MVFVIIQKCSQFHSSSFSAEKIDETPLEDMSDNMKAVYAPGGVKKKEGEKITRPKLANLLERISETSRAEGVALFYSGDIGKEIVKAVRKIHKIDKFVNWLKVPGPIS